MQISTSAEEEYYLPVQYRLGLPQDLPYVSSSWFLSNRNIGDNNFIDIALYQIEQNKIINKLLAQSQLFVAYLEDQPNVIIAYQVYQYLQDKCFLHWINTIGNGSLYRGHGLHTRILQHINPDNKLQLVLTSFPTNRKKLFEHWRYKYNALYDPYFIHRNYD